MEAPAHKLEAACMPNRRAQPATAHRPCHPRAVAAAIITAYLECSTEYRNAERRKSDAPVDVANGRGDSEVEPVKPWGCARLGLHHAVGEQWVLRHDAASVRTVGAEERAMTRIFRVGRL